MKTKLCILDADYFMEENRPVVRLWCKDERGRTVVAHDRRVTPYFYIEPKDGADLKELEKKVKTNGSYEDLYALRIKQHSIKR